MKGKLSGFNPRALRGARHSPACVFSWASWFQSTRPAWGATASVWRKASAALFQSTRPAWGATSRNANSMSNVVFQSTRPAWGATALL